MQCLCVSWCMQDGSLNLLSNSRLSHRTSRFLGAIPRSPLASEFTLTFYLISAELQRRQGESVVPKHLHARGCQTQLLEPYSTAHPDSSAPSRGAHSPLNSHIFYLIKRNCRGARRERCAEAS